MIKYQDRVGKKFKHLTILSLGPTKKFKSRPMKTFNCSCDCGNTITAFATHVINGTTTSCGCGRRNPNAETSIRRLYSHYMRKAANRQLEFALAIDKFQELTSGNCYYCNSGPTNKIQGGLVHNSYLYNGIDRKDNNKGYIEDNVVSCCKHCNYAKRTLSVNQFLDLIKQIYQHRLENQIFITN